MTLAKFPSSRPGSLLGSLAFGLGVAVFAAVPGCSDDAAPETTGGAGSASTGTAGSSGGTAGSAGGAAGSASGTDSGALTCKAQMSSEIGDRCNADAGLIKQEANTCPTSPGDASTADDDGGEEEYPPPHSGTFAPDDDCKYDVTYGVLCDGGAATFTLHLVSRATGMPVTGAAPSIEASLDTHLLPNTPQPVSTEVGMGDYKITNVPLDKEGFWTVRFHFFETCLETEETSKHSHVAFTVIVQ